VHLGRDFETARRAVSVINGRTAADPVQIALAKIEHPVETVGEHIEWYKERIDAKHSKRGKALATGTLYEYKRILDDIGLRLVPARSIADVDRRVIASILDDLPGWASNRYRQLLRDLFRHAAACGLRENNPVEATIAKDVAVVRQRLKFEHFNRIRDEASPWFQRAMDLALWSLQRESDLVLLRLDEHWRDGVLRLAQIKGQRRATRRLAIKPGAHLMAAIVSCLNSPERVHRKFGECPYLVHRIPDRYVKAKWKLHPMQIAPEMLSREFAAARDRLCLFDDLEETQKPSFHEIRALGGDRYREVLQWPEGRVQALMGPQARR
jgi:enterobacteria phage integrase